MDGAYEPERYDAQSVRAIGHVFGQDEALERGQCDGGPVLARILTKPAMVTGSSSSPIIIRSLPLLFSVSRSYSAVVYLLEYLEVWILGTSPYLRVLGEGGCC
jgi:hypothetical protein